jgi:hypothetical protein
MKNEIMRSGGFALQPTNMEEAMKLAQMISGSEIVPKCYKGKPGDTLVAMMLGTELGLNPIQSLQNIAVINGRPSIYGDALLALMQNHPAFGGIDEAFDEATMTATCTVWRKGGNKHTQTFSKADAESAGLWGKAGPWTQYKKRMLQMRARGFAVRDQFSDALAGLITREEAEDMPQAEVDVTPRQLARPAIAHYPDADFETNFPKWAGIIESGKKTPQQIIEIVSSKAVLTESQRTAILDLSPVPQEGEAA